MLMAASSTMNASRYFMVATSEGGEFHCDQIIVEDEPRVSTLIAVFIRNHPFL